VVTGAGRISGRVSCSQACLKPTISPWIVVWVMTNYNKIEEAVVVQFDCHSEQAFFAQRGIWRAARSVAFFATQQSRVWLASLPNCTTTEEAGGENGIRDAKRNQCPRSHARLSKIAAPADPPRLRLVPICWKGSRVRGSTAIPPHSLWEGCDASLRHCAAALRYRYWSSPRSRTPLLR
jgi:hypothetical protein